MINHRNTMKRGKPLTTPLIKLSTELKKKRKGVPYIMAANKQKRPINTRIIANPSAKTASFLPQLVLSRIRLKQMVAIALTMIKAIKIGKTRLHVMLAIIFHLRFQKTH